MTATVVGVLVTIVGVLVIWASQSDTDSDGYFTSAPARFATTSHAILSDEFRIADAPGWLDDRIGTIRIQATGAKPVFLGVATRSDLDAYLKGVSRDVVTDLSFDPIRPTYQREPGVRTPEPPASQRFWAAKASGPGRQTLTWKVTDGSWAVLAMNADGSAGIAATATLGAKVGFLVWVGIIMLAVGIALLVGGVFLIRGARKKKPRTPPAGPAAIDEYA